MGYTLEIVALAVSEIVHGVGVPLVASADMRNVKNTINQWVAEQHVGVSHVDLGAQHKCSRLAFTAVHKLEELQILLNRTITEWAVGTWTCGGSLLLSNDLCTLLVNIGTALLDQPNGKIPKLLEIVAGIVDVSPLETKPLDIVLDALDIFCILLNGVGVIEAQITCTTIFLGKSEIDSNSLGVSDVQIAIWLWWETGLQSTSVLTLSQIIDHLLLNEANRSFLLAFVLNNLFHILIFFFYLFTFLPLLNSSLV